MATTHIHRPWLDDPRFRAAPAPDVDDSSDLDLYADDAPKPRRARRIAVRALGGLCFIGAAAALAWMATGTDVRDAIATWGTFGRTSQPQLASSEDAAPYERDTLDQTATTLLWAVGPAPAELSRPGVEDTEAQVSDSIDEPNASVAEPAAEGDVTAAPPSVEEEPSRAIEDPYGPGDI